MQSLSRRELLRSASCGFGYLAMTGLAHEVALAARPAEGFSSPLLARPAHFPGAASVIISVYAGRPLTHRHVRPETRADEIGRSSG